ncbi:MAG: GIY-YIG nuclease family protein [Melioribacteraceae bacterium]|nr:GIY-YIG nuclease family protein [Melioribacteraceae bacterium]
MFYVYVLCSKKDHKRYIGLTNNLEKRLAQHNAGLVKPTKFRRPLELIYLEEFESRSSAAMREKFFKSGFGRDFLNSKGI